MTKNEFVCDCNIIHEDRVSNVKKNIPNEYTFNDLADLFKLIGDTTRCKILFTLDNNEMCVCDIANVLSMTKSAVSHQLATLRRSGVVKCRKSGKEVYYTLDDEHITKLSNFFNLFAKYDLPDPGKPTNIINVGMLFFI